MTKLQRAALCLCLIVVISPIFWGVWRWMRVHYICQEIQAIRGIISAPVGFFGQPDLVMFKPHSANGLSGDKYEEKLLRVLRMLPELGSVEGVNLVDTPVGDEAVTILNKLDDLTHLYLQGTRVTAKSVPILMSMKKLEALNVRETAISDEDIDRLKAALPNTKFAPFN